MIDYHRYNRGHWVDYYQGKIDEDTRMEMTLHLSGCDECLDKYTDCVQANISVAPLRIKKEIMKEVNKSNSSHNTKQIMFAYVTAACIALGFYSFGLFDKTIDHVPKSMNQSLKAIETVANNVNKITNNYIWRDLNEK